MYISGVEERIIESIRENGGYSLGEDTTNYCQYCESMQLVDTRVISGREGHIDNWLPDEYISYCQSCGHTLED